MPSIVIIFSYLIYITSFDNGEPFHCHVVSLQYKNSPSREDHSAKIWLGKFGEATLASNKGRINTKELNEIIAVIRKQYSIYEKILKTWCRFFGVTPKDVNYYRNIEEHSHGMRR